MKINKTQKDLIFILI